MHHDHRLRNLFEFLRLQYARAFDGVVSASWLMIDPHFTCPLELFWHVEIRALETRQKYSTTWGLRKTRKKVVWNTPTWKQRVYKFQRAVAEPLWVLENSLTLHYSSSKRRQKEKEKKMSTQPPKQPPPPGNGKPHPAPSFGNLPPPRGSVIRAIIYGNSWSCYDLNPGEV